MTRPKKRFLAAALAVALLGGAYALLLNHPAKEKDSDSETVSLTSVDSEDVSAITVTPRKGTAFTVKISSDDSGTEYRVKGDKSGSYDQNSLSTLLSTASAVSGTLVDPVCTELERYGLDDTAKHDVVTLTQTDGTEIKLIFGMTSEALGGTYCMVDGSTDVYFVSSDTVEPLLQKQKAYLSLSVLGSYYALTSSLEQMTITPANGTAMTIVRRDTDDMDSEVSSAYSTFQITAPEACDADDDALSNKLLSKLQSGLTAQAIAKEHADEEDMARYGLDTPQMRIRLAFDNESFTLLVGNTKGENIYVMTEDGDTIYRCRAEYYSFVDSLDWTDYRTSQLVAFAKRELKSAVLTYGGSTHKATVRYVAADENEDSDSATYKGKLDGKTMKSKAIDQLYTALSSLDAVSVSDAADASGGEEVLSLSIRLRGGTKHTLSFVKSGSREYLVRVDDGGYRYTVSQTDFDNLLSSFGAEQ